MNDAQDQIVITGAGVVSALGLSREETWQSVLAARPGMRPLTAMESEVPGGAVGGQAPDLPPDFAPGLPREVRYLKWTVDQALRESGVNGAMPYPAERCACLLGTTLHGMRAAGRFFRSGDYAALRQFLSNSTLSSMAPKSLWSGLTASNCSACSSSLGSIALAVTWLQSEMADLVIAGGYDTITEYAYGGFSSLRLVADGPLRPFAKDRRGMKLAEGYGIVILERGGDAARRGAKPIAAIAGWGESADAHHLTQPHPQGDGAARAVTQALMRAGLEPSDIDLVAAHATGTPDNDAGEYAAFDRVFGSHLPDVPVVAFKSHLGHTLGGAGAVELILSAMSLRDQVIAGCANVRAEEIEFPGLNLALGTPRRANLRRTLNTSLGFGGANTCIILESVREDAARAPRAHPRPDGEVFITGVGAIVPGMVGNDALLARLHGGGPAAYERDAGSVPENELEGLLNARRVRRMSDYVKLTLGATTLACRDAGISDVASFASNCAAVLGSMHASSNYSVAYYEQIIKEGLAAANPMLFAEAVPNGGAAQLSLMLSLRGACQTIIGTRSAGLDALALASARIRSGAWDHAIVSAGEEYCELVCEAYRQCGASARHGCAPFGGEGGFVSGAGAVTFILESRGSMERRGARPRGRIDATASHFGDGAHAGISVQKVLEALGDPANIISSACGTWIDRAESAAIKRANGAQRVSSIYGHVAETFSASPLIAIASVLLSGKMPRLLGDGWSDKRVLPASGNERADSFAAICTDFIGAVSGVRIASL